jgi:hypothetical protein
MSLEGLVRSGAAQRQDHDFLDWVSDHKSSLISYNLIQCYSVTYNTVFTVSIDLLMRSSRDTYSGRV